MRTIDERYDILVHVTKRRQLDLIVEVEKYNDYHDPKTGRFARKPGGAAIPGKSPAKFAQAVENAKSTQPEEHRWRVTAHSQSELESDYKGAKLHVTKGGSTVAVTTDGDIVSVCKNLNDKGASGKDLMRMAVDAGGRKLDSFSGNHGFYVKCGFEPVSWTPFNEEYAPTGWRKGVDQPEPIVFYKYTGKNTGIKLGDFLANTRPFEGPDGYDMAMAYRDQSMTN